MSRFYQRRTEKITINPAREEESETEAAQEVKISVITYNESGSQEKAVTQIRDCLPPSDAQHEGSSAVTWIDISGPLSSEMIAPLREQFDLHPLLLEKLLTPNQRPKLEDYDKRVFIVLRMLRYNEEKHQVEDQQASIVLGPGWVLSFEEEAWETYDAVRDRIKNAGGRIRKMGSDYLAYALLDAVVDSFFLVLEKLGNRVESLEDAVVLRANPHTLSAIHHLKRQLLFLRRSTWPLREVLSSLQRGESSLLSDQILVYLCDVHDNTLQVIETVEAFRDIVAGTLDIYLSSASNRMNEIMTVLTIIATIFIPLTFITGIYGMNFHRMLELSWHYGYFWALGLMVVVALGMIAYFRHKKWF